MLGLREIVIWPISHSKLEAEPGIEPRSPWLQVQYKQAAMEFKRRWNLS